MKKYIVISILCLIVFIIGCDRGLEFIDIEITKFPKNIVYYAGRDTQLNLDGGEVKLTIRDGKDFYYEMTEEEFQIIHSVDFNSEGVYVVEIRRTPELYSRFPIQVVEIGPSE